MAKTIEQYMSKTRADYGSGVARPKIEDKDNFEIKGQFLKELCTNTFSGSDHEDANEHIEKVLEIVDLFHIPNITIDQVMLRAFPMSLTRVASRWLRNERTGSITTWDGLKTKFLNIYCPLARTAKKMEEINNFQQEPGAIPSKTAADTKVAIQEMAEYSQKWDNRTSRSRSTETSDGLAAIQAQLNNLGKEINRLNGYYCEEKKGSYRPQFSKAYSEASHINNYIPRKEKDLGSFTLPCFINNVCFNNALVDLGASVSVMPLSTYLNLGLGELAHTKLTVELANRTICPRIHSALDPWKTIFVYSPIRASIDVYKRKITLRVEEERIVFISVKPASSLIKRVYMLSLRERMELDLEARLIGKTLMLNRSLDPFFKDYIELTDLNEPFELRRNQGNDLMPTIEEGEVIEEFRTRDDELDARIDDYPRALMNVPIFVGTFSIVIDFAVLENIDAYRDEGMGNVIFGELFLREVGIKTRRFKGMITIYNGNDEVTYQMVRSHPRFKHHTNEQCNKIPPLLKVSEEDKMNGISHPYQKLKGFYKGVLNLGPDYIRDAKMEEWLTRGHISVHEMEQ
ncbi:putative reverse transcriptase domain-containing protein [Tanacetum coccineum]